jgi:hypothetical protein
MYQLQDRHPSPLLVVWTAFSLLNMALLLSMIFFCVARGVMSYKDVMQNATQVQYF